MSAGSRDPQWRAALWFPGQADPASPDRRNAGADLVAARPGRDVERLRDRMLRWTTLPSGRVQDPVAYRLSVLSDPRARASRRACRPMRGLATRTAVGTGRGRGIGFARYKNMAAYAAVVAEVEVDESVRLLRVWCAADAGLVINPDGAINQLEGGIIQAASWALKEGVRLDTGGISSRDWESYPVLRFTRGAGGRGRAGQPRRRSPPLRRRRGERRPDRRGNRQRRRARARRAHPRSADDPRAGHGGVAEGVAVDFGEGGFKGTPAAPVSADNLQAAQATIWRWNSIWGQDERG